MEKLNEFIDKHVIDNVIQGGSEWLTRRRSTIGGSEIGTIMGVNPFGDLESFIIGKCGLETTPTYNMGDLVVDNEGKFYIIEEELSYNNKVKMYVFYPKRIKSSVGRTLIYKHKSEIELVEKDSDYYTLHEHKLPITIVNNILSLAGNNINTISNNKLPLNWGLLFEDVNQWYSEITFDTDIKYTEIYLGNFESHDRISFSPDGIAEVNNKLVLFEFKCPFNRDIDEEPLTTYKYQVKLGLEMIPLLDHGIITRAVFRLLDDNFSLKENNLLQNTRSYNKIFACGFICFTTSDVYKHGTYKPINLATLDKVSFSMVISRLTRLKTTKYFNFAKEFNNDPIKVRPKKDKEESNDKCIDVKQVPVDNPKEKPLFIKLKNFMNKELHKITKEHNNIFAYIPWCLFDIRYDEIGPDGNIINDYGEYISTIFEFIDEINSINEVEYDDDEIREEKLRRIKNFVNFINKKDEYDDDLSILEG